jgi:hypothetical protein
MTYDGPQRYAERLEPMRTRLGMLHWAHIGYVAYMVCMVHSVRRKRDDWRRVSVVR